jgi:FtsZ-binding cell division protein ZapB
METPSLPATGPEAWAQQFHAALRAHRDRTCELLAAQQARLTQAAALVEQELQRLEEKNAQLQQELAKSRTTTTDLARQPRQPGRLDWEAEKRRILAALEAEGDGDELAEVVQTTGEVIAAKDRTIGELNARLEEQSGHAAVMAPAALPAEQTMAKDAALREERERLKLLQAQWQEKIRQAEVELALERAKIARQRADLEGHAPTAADGAAESPRASDTDQPAKPATRRRWMARLGLTDADREPTRHP